MTRTPLFRERRCPRGRTDNGLMRTFHLSPPQPRCSSRTAVGHSSGRGGDCRMLIESETVLHFAVCISCPYFIIHHRSLTHPFTWTASRGVCAFLLSQVYNPLLLALFDVPPHPCADNFGSHYLPHFSQFFVRQAVETIQTVIFAFVLDVRLWPVRTPAQPTTTLLPNEDWSF